MNADEEVINEVLTHSGDRVFQALPDTTVYRVDSRGHWTVLGCPSLSGTDTLTFLPVS